MYNFEDMKENHFIDMVCLINSIMVDIEENKLKSFKDLISFYQDQILDISSKEITSEEEDMQMINLKVEYEMIFNNPTFFGNLF